MLRDDAVARVAQGLGFRSDLNSLIVEELKAAQRQLEGGQTLPWFIINEDSPLTLVEDQAEYELSEWFIREADDFGFEDTAQSRAGDIYHVRKMDYAKAVAHYGFEAKGYPQVYALRPSSIVIFPIPDDEYLYNWHFYQRQTVLDTNIENQWLKFVPDLLIAMAGEALAMDLRDEIPIKKFTTERIRWEAWLKREIAARLEANEHVVMGSDR